MSTLVPVILAGGSGTRLWPVSRDTMPKQLARLAGEQSLLEQTARRLLARARPEQIVMVGAKAQDFLVRRALEAIDPALAQNRLIEPVGRNTAAAIGLAALHVQERFGSDALLWVCPSDHLMQAPDALYAALEAALPVAAAGGLVTFGITPTRPETGYGYIETGEPMPGAQGVLRVARFVEKPKRPAAEAMLAAGGHLWNSGMFLFRADRILAELGTHAPPILAGVGHAFAALKEAQGGAFEVPLEQYEKIPGAADRQGGHGAERPDRGRALRSGVVRPRLLAGALGAAAQGRGRQRGRAAMSCSTTARTA